MHKELQVVISHFISRQGVIQLIPFLYRGLTYEVGIKII